MIPQLQIFLAQICLPISRKLLSEFVHCQYVICVSMREEDCLNFFDVDPVEVSNDIVYSSRSI